MFGYEDITALVLIIFKKDFILKKTVDTLGKVSDMTAEGLKTKSRLSESEFEFEFVFVAFLPVESPSTSTSTPSIVHPLGTSTESTGITGVNCP